MACCANAHKHNTFTLHGELIRLVCEHTHRQHIHTLMGSRYGWCVGMHTYTTHSHVFSTLTVMSNLVNKGNHKSFGMFVIGQYFTRPVMTVSASLQSFSRNWEMQSDNC
jgi:hypothetical protein